MDFGIEKNFFQNDIFLRSKYRYFSEEAILPFSRAEWWGFKKFGAAQKTRWGSILLLSKKKLFLFLFFPTFSSFLRCFFWCCCLLRRRGFRFHSLFNNGSPTRFRRRFPVQFPLLQNFYEAMADAYVPVV